MFAYPDISTRGVGKFLNSYANLRLRGFAWLSRILPTLLVFISSYANTENVFYCLNIILLPCCDIFYLIILIYFRDGTFSIFISFYSVMWHFLPKGWLFLCYSTHNLDLWFVGKNIGNKEEIIIFHSNTFYDCESYFKILILASRRKKKFQVLQSDNVRSLEFNFHLLFLIIISTLQNKIEIVLLTVPCEEHP